MTNYEYIEKALQYAQFISEGHTIPQAAKEFRVNESTIYRHIKRLEHFPQYRGLYLRAKVVSRRYYYSKSIPEIKGQL